METALIVLFSLLLVIAFTVRALQEAKQADDELDEYYRLVGDDSDDPQY